MPALYFTEVLKNTPMAITLVMRHYIIKVLLKINRSCATSLLQMRMSHKTYVWYALNSRSLSAAARISNVSAQIESSVN